MPAYNASTAKRTSAARRQRSAGHDSTTAMIAKSLTVADAKARFVETVARGVEVLMEECGYSRERATSALLREISRGDNSPPGEDEVLQAMRDHGLSIDAATKALTVSKALQREIAERNVSMVEAIDDLTSKLSFANLVRMESQSAIPAPPTASDDTSTRPRIQPVPVLATQVRSKTTPTTTTTTTTSGNSAARKTKSNNKKEVCAKKGKSTSSGTAGRKRSMDEVNNSNNQSAESSSKPPSRGRADSVSEEVNAKLAENKAKLSDDEVAPQAPSRSAPGVASAVRSKRGRVDGDSDTPNMKRTRTNEL